MSNQYDFAYRVGYVQGYESSNYVNNYCKFTETQNHAKYDNGYKDGHEMRTNERLVRGRKS